MLDQNELENLLNYGLPLLPLFRYRVKWKKEIEAISRHFFYPRLICSPASLSNVNPQTESPTVIEFGSYVEIIWITKVARGIFR